MAVFADAAVARAAAFKGLPGERATREPPSMGAAAGSERARVQAFTSELRARPEERDGKQFTRVDGYASIVERSYPMWDIFGGYEEQIASTAFDRTLAAKPDVAFLLNHRGMTMARTTNGTLELSSDSQGLRSVAWLNPERQDVKDLLIGINDGVVTEMSFAFTIEDATWSDDYTKYRITEVDLDRGDVSAVNFGANPFTSLAARSREMLQDLRRLPVESARVVLAELQHRDDLTPKQARVADTNLGGRSLTQIEAWLHSQQ